MIQGETFASIRSDLEFFHGWRGLVVVCEKGKGARRLLGSLVD
jgi:hypothetical protein